LLLPVKPLIVDISLMSGKRLTDGLSNDDKFDMVCDFIYRASEVNDAYGLDISDSGWWM